MSLYSLSGDERAQKALYQARRAWNQLWSLSGGDGRKFSYRLRVFLDEMQATRTFEAKLMTMAIHKHVQELNAKKQSALQEWA